MLTKGQEDGLVVHIQRQAEQYLAMTILQIKQEAYKLARAHPPTHPTYLKAFEDSGSKCNGGGAFYHHSGAAGQLFQHY